MTKTFGQGKEEVARLSQYFATNHQAFLASTANEAQIRQALIDPLFEALGWDVHNSQHHAPQLMEVIYNPTLDDEGERKEPDYAFRAGQTVMFFAEAKKCDAAIKTDPRWSYQLRRYGWSAKVAVSILTDFEELGVYDCTLRPRKGDKASHARILYFGFDEYPDRWRELWDIFSREAVWSGAFDQYAASKRKRGTSEVDVEFLKEIEKWRDELARNIALRNHALSDDELNRAVQLTIDRIVFLRMAEDRGLEPFDHLSTICEQPEIYERFMKLCRKADDKYNSGLFHFQKEAAFSEPPDNITPRLAIDDKVFKPILQSLYYDHGSPYVFKVLPVEILGTVYERFLGKVIRLTPGHQAKVEPKPEVRKAGGVYYTPGYIVDYIVRQTVAHQIEGKSPAQLAGKGKVQPLRVLDMACGSGSFLLGAYRCLLDHCLKWYVDNGPENFPDAVYEAHPVAQPPVAQPPSAVSSAVFAQTVAQPPSAVSAAGPQATQPGAAGPQTVVSAAGPQATQPGAAGPQTVVSAAGPQTADWRLTIAEKKRILTTHVFGVDIDPQAVEVSKLSLLLKVLEGESAQTVGQQLKLIHIQRMLPNLSENIKCGNSLIGPDYFTGRLIPDAEELTRVNAFDWQREFPAVFPSPPGRGQGEGGGFDCVIGNPPWGATLGEGELEYLRARHNRVVARMIDSYIYFTDKALRLTKDARPVGYIIPATLLNQVDTLPLRDVLLERGMGALINMGQGIFGKKVLNTSSIFVSCTREDSLILGDLSKVPIETRQAALACVKQRPYFRWEKTVKADPHHTFFTRDLGESSLLNRLRRHHNTLGTAIEGTIQRGVSPDIAAAHVVPIAGAKRLRLEKDLLRPSLSGTQIKRYHPWESDQVIIYTTRQTRIDNYPHCHAFLTTFKPDNTCKEVEQKKHPWWALHRPRNPGIFAAPKLIGLTTTKTIELVLDESDGLFVTDAMYVFTPRQGIAPKALMAVMQSRVFHFLYGVANMGEARVIPQIKASKLLTLPIPDMAQCGRLPAMADRMLDLNSHLAAANSVAQKKMIQRQIDATDGEIDRLVYDLYGLTPDEIALVEGNGH